MFLTCLFPYMIISFLGTGANGNHSLNRKLFSWKCFRPDVSVPYRFCHCGFSDTSPPFSQKLLGFCSYYCLANFVFKL